MSRRPNGRRPPADPERAIARLSSLRIAALRRLWTEWFGDNAPICQSAELLRRLVAWRIQEERFGGLPAETKRRLKQIGSGANGSASTPPIPIAFKPGTMITRAWRGTVQRVHVLETGFAHEGKHYRSLSEIARRITGKRWSGPRFFGVERAGQRQALRLSGTDAHD